MKKYKEKIWMKITNINILRAQISNISQITRRILSSSKKNKS